jgi:hypothetical protein
VGEAPRLGEAVAPEGEVGGLMETELISGFSRCSAILAA